MEDVAGLVSRFRELCASREPDLFEGALLVAELVDSGDDSTPTARAARLRASPNECARRPARGFPG